MFIRGVGFDIGQHMPAARLELPLAWHGWGGAARCRAHLPRSGKVSAFHGGVDAATVQSTDEVEMGRICARPLSIGNRRLAAMLRTVYVDAVSELVVIDQLR